MIVKERVDRILSCLESGKGTMEGQSAEQLLICDPYAVFYLTGKLITPGERFLGLLLQKGRTPILYVNELFRFDKDLGVVKKYYSDTDDVTKLVSPDLDPSLPLAVDKTMAARFLLPLMEAGAASFFLNGSLAVDLTRSVKDEQEKAALRKASLVNDAAMDEFKKLIREGVTELEVADQMLAIYKKLGASGYSFDPIVAFGDNAADPHHSPDNTVLKEGDAVLFDVGCVVDNYCSDMTRTFYKKKYPSKEVERVYDLVRRANEEAEAMIKPGVPICSVDRKARDIISEGGYGPDFTHRLGHFIGLQDHEFGDVSTTNFRPEEEGIAHSVEPGIYHPGVAGVRIEDLIIVTKDGCEVLNHYPKDIEVIG